MVILRWIPKSEFDRVRSSVSDYTTKLTLLAEMARANTLAAVKKAGSGHLGSSLSAMDIVTFLYNAEMNTIENGIDSPDRDIYFSSKGHDVPGLYAVLHSFGIVSSEKLGKLRRIDGLDGHPDISIPGIEANTGSLGMGIAKARGMAAAKRLQKRQGHVYVLTGDGELQEGQIWESLQVSAHQKIPGFTVIVDHNKVQTDKLITDIIDLGDLPRKLEAFGWAVLRCDGHDFDALARALTERKRITDRPVIIIADTIKGKGVSFMEHPQALKTGNGIYKWHSGAPDDESFTRAHTEVIERINSILSKTGLSPVAFEKEEEFEKTAGGVTTEYVADAYGKALVELGKKHPNLVVLDADLSADCRVRGFETTFPDRFFENGIAEQDMVSLAGGLAKMGMIPVVNSFASFLASRANEQIYNNATEETKIIYALHYAGLIPAGPGKSHQSLRDISLGIALPNMTIVQPCNSEETELVLSWAVEQAIGPCMVRLAIGPSPRRIQLSEDYVLQPGQGSIIQNGSDAAIVAYGPVLLSEALAAAEQLKESGIHVAVVNMPWLNRIDPQWFSDLQRGFPKIVILDDHHSRGGLFDTIKVESSHYRNSSVFHQVGVEKFPLWGTPSEVLSEHGLDARALSTTIRTFLEANRNNLI